MMGFRLNQSLLMVSSKSFIDSTCGWSRCPLEHLVILGRRGDEDDGRDVLGN